MELIYELSHSESVKIFYSRPGDNIKGSFLLKNQATPRTNHQKKAGAAHLGAGCHHALNNKFDCGTRVTNL